MLMSWKKINWRCKMKLCPQCKKVEIDDKYGMCLDCLGKTKQANSGIDLSEIKDLIEKCNWNFGAIHKYIKLSLLNQLETIKNDRGLTKIQQAMLNELENGLEKDLKQLKGIKMEQEK